MRPQTVGRQTRDEPRQRSFVFGLGNRRRPAVDHILPEFAEPGLARAFKHQQEFRPIGGLRAGLHIGRVSLRRRCGGGFLARRLRHRLFPAFGQMLVGRKDQLFPRREVVDQPAPRQLRLFRDSIEGDGGDAITLDDGDDRIEDLRALARSHRIIPLSARNRSRIANPDHSCAAALR